MKSLLREFVMHLKQFLFLFNRICQLETWVLIYLPQYSFRGEFQILHDTSNNQGTKIRYCSKIKHFLFFRSFKEWKSDKESCCPHDSKFREAWSIFGWIPHFFFNFTVPTLLSTLAHDNITFFEYQHLRIWNTITIQFIELILCNYQYHRFSINCVSIDLKYKSTSVLLQSH